MCMRHMQMSSLLENAGKNMPTVLDMPNSRYNKNKFLIQTNSKTGQENILESMQQTMLSRGMLKQTAFRNKASIAH